MKIQRLTRSNAMQLWLGLAVLLLGCLMLSCRQKGEWEPFEQEGKWGFKNPAGQVVIEPRFLSAYPFTAAGIAAVADEQGWVYINQQAQFIIRPYIYDNGPDYFQEGLARYVDNEKIGFMQESGRIVIAAQYEYASSFSEGRAVVGQGFQTGQEGEQVTRLGGKWGFIDPTGKLVVPLEYDEVEPYAEGKAKVRKGKDWLWIDRAGNPVP